ncbi:beta-ketoacyl-ACP synthase II [Pendulispora albinea]|uniref:3-oxoacyl-[acyl-carrier-protein] synthase 2 n=1 Tax=Pendulispora albinea TaxID=2741071 RepID=A0ABZ2LXX9_9BACT
MRRVVVTGLGCVSPLGNDADTTFTRLLEGQSGIGPITHFDPKDHLSQIAGEVRGFDISQYVPSRKAAKHMDTFVHFAIAAADMAIADSGLSLDAVDRERAGAVIGTGVGGLQVIEAQQRTLLARGPRAVSPYLIPMFLGNLAPGHLAIRYGLKGPNVHVSTACATGTHAIGEAGHVIARGDADVMLAGGSEAGTTPLLVAGFCAANALSTRNDRPEEASRPFDRERDGFVMGEGAGILVLEELEHARKRGATILAELRGYGLTDDAHHVTAPEQSGDGAKRAMQAAIARAKIHPEEVDYVNAHGTATPLGDRMETNALKAVFKEHATSRKLWISSTKSMIGHLLGAAGAVEAIVCIQTIARSKVHPTINLRTPDPECDLDYVANEGRDRKVRVALSNSFGFGGHNATLLFAAFEG